MRFSIVTPSFNGWPLTALCVASVADQAVEVEHIIQDPGSKDATLEKLQADPRVRLYVEKDSGMYDAINRGFDRAGGDVLAWLNCDEQYLPGALKAVRRLFELRPELDMVFGDVVFVDGNGEYLYHRKMQTPLKYHTWTCHLSTLSCAMFFRRKIFERHRLDPRLRDVGDSDWLLRVMRDGVRMATLGRFTSVFTQTGANMSARPNALLENRELRESAPWLAQRLRPLIIAHHRLRRWLGGMYSQAPFGFDLYTPGSPTVRVTRQVTRPVSRSPALQPGVLSLL